MQISISTNHTSQGLRVHVRKYKEALAVAHVEKDEVENKYESKMSFLDNELNATLVSTSAACCSRICKFMFVCARVLNPYHYLIVHKTHQNESTFNKKYVLTWVKSSSLSYASFWIFTVGLCLCE